MNKKRISIIILIIGIIALIAGVVFLIVKLNAGPSIADGEYLVSIGQWTLKNKTCAQLECEESTECISTNNESTTCENSNVIWTFTEIGKGTLTTNNHLNDYDFIWALEDGKLKIETDWLYTLNDEYSYTLDQGNNTLTLTSSDATFDFIPVQD